MNILSFNYGVPVYLRVRSQFDDSCFELFCLVDYAHRSVYIPNPQDRENIGDIDEFTDLVFATLNSKLPTPSDDVYPSNQISAAFAEVSKTADENKEKHFGQLGKL